MTAILVVLCATFFVSFPGLMVLATKYDKEREEEKAVFMRTCLQETKPDKCESIWTYRKR